MLIKTRFLAACLSLALLLSACAAPASDETPAAASQASSASMQSPTSTEVIPPTNTATLPPSPTAPATPTPVPTDTPWPDFASPPLAHLTAGTEPYFTELKMFDALTGWAVGGLNGSRDHLFTTRDGGNSWQDVTPPQPSEPGTLAVAAFFQDDSTAWATYYGETMDVLFPQWPVVWHSTDAGLTWQPSQPLDLTGLEFTYQNELVFPDAQHGWLLTHVGAGMSHDYVTIYQTTDGGLTWTRLLDPYNDVQIQGCSKTGLTFLDSQAGWLTGNCNGVMAGAFLSQTTDGGTTWTYVDLPAPADQPLLYDVNSWAACGSYDLHFFDPQNAVLGVRCTLYSQDSSEPTFTNYIYTTQDGGATWSSQPYPGGTLLFVSPQIGWALGRDIYQTSDAGLTWDQVNTVHWDASFDFISPQLGWAASYTETENALVATTDGGAHWFMLEPMIAP